MNKFFISTAIGFEPATLEEMKAIWPFLLGKDAKVHGLPFPEVKIFSGGIELECDFFIGLQFNFFLKTAHRILLRMAEFKARDLPKFYQKMKSLPWKDYLKSQHVEWEIAAKTSRVNNEKRLQESAQAALDELFVGGTDTALAGTIYVRMEDDLCTISLDSTGDHLHKRGTNVLKGDAPLRETISAYLVQQLQEATSEELRQKVTLLDPMVGSGSLLSEARAQGTGQFQRPFAFQNWKRTPKLFLSDSFAFNYSLPVPKSYAAYWGFDVDKKVLQAAQANFAEVERQLAVVQKKNFSGADIQLTHQNALESEVILPPHLWMILNPPYGERLPVAGEGGLQSLIQELCKRYRPERLGVLYPDKERVRKAPPGYKLLKEVKINNGGLRCLFTVLVAASQS